jgi:HK97 family phage prohead protease
MKGYAIVFDALSSDRGGYVVRIAPQAVDRTLNGNADVRALIDHDSAKVIGRKSAGTLSFAKDAKGLGVSIDIPETTYGNDLVVSMRRGDISGMSFGTSILKDEWDDSGKVPVRTILDMQFHEVSVVTFPAFEDTSAALASFAAYREAKQKGMSVDIARRKLALALLG